MTSLQQRVRQLRKDLACLHDTIVSLEPDYHETTYEQAPVYDNAVTQNIMFNLQEPLTENDFFTIEDHPVIDIIGHHNEHRSRSLKSVSTETLREVGEWQGMTHFTETLCLWEPCTEKQQQEIGQDMINTGPSNSAVQEESISPNLPIPPPPSTTLQQKEDNNGRGIPNQLYTVKKDETPSSHHLISPPPRPSSILQQQQDEQDRELPKLDSKSSFSSSPLSNLSPRILFNKHKILTPPTRPTRSPAGCVLGRRGVDVNEALEALGSSSDAAWCLVTRGMYSCPWAFGANADFR